MIEDFLHFIWKYQYFNKEHLCTTKGVPVNILRPGVANTNAGPDFLNAKIKIGDLEWNGHVEIHINSKSWYSHNHQKDAAYDNVILHVVWNGQDEVSRHDGSTVPTIAIHNLVDPDLLNNYNKILSEEETLLCNRYLPGIKAIKVLEVFDKAVSKRLEDKALNVSKLLRNNKKDWEETTFHLLASNFGFNVNKESFLTLAKSIELKTILKHADNLLQVEALLFGQAGFLEEHFDDDYFKLLKKEYNFLNAKYGLKPRQLKRHQWKFLRMRPANFPTLRIAQLARVLSNRQKIFSMILNADDVAQVRKIFQLSPSDYWQCHYAFGKPTKRKIGKMGKNSIENIIINTFVPILAAYSIENDDQGYMEKALMWLQDLDPEINNKTKLWGNAGIKIKSAFDSQAAIEMINNYCTKKRCLECNIGVSLIKN